MTSNAKPVSRVNETPTGLVRRARRISRELGDLYPRARCELDFSSPLELLVATILSAQCTDKRVNLVTPTLFARYPDAAAYAAADREELEMLIKSTGFFRAKTKSLMGLGQALCDRFGGEVPGRLKDLVTLPGVGRKTANVVLGNAFGVPGITVDTHFGRLARRFGWTEEMDPDKVEAAVGALFPRKDWTSCRTGSFGMAAGAATRANPHAERVRSPACVRRSARVLPIPSWRRDSSRRMGSRVPARVAADEPAGQVTTPPWLRPLVAATQGIAVHDLTRFAPPDEAQRSRRFSCCSAKPTMARTCYSSSAPMTCARTRVSPRFPAVSSMWLTTGQLRPRCARQLKRPGLTPRVLLYWQFSPTSGCHPVGSS